MTKKITIDRAVVEQALDLIEGNYLQLPESAAWKSIKELRSTHTRSHLASRCQMGRYKELLRKQCRHASCRGLGFGKTAKDITQSLIFLCAIINLPEQLSEPTESEATNGSV